MVDFELAKAIEFFVREKTLLGLKSGEHLLILSNSEDEHQVVEAIAGIAGTAGAKVIVLSYPQFTQFPPKELYKHMEGALKNSDVILELGMKRIYSYQKASQHGARYFATGGFNRNKVVRLITGYNYPKMIELGKNLVRLTKRASKIRVVSTAGTDIQCYLDLDRPVLSMEEIGLLPGIIGWAPVEESINGRAVFDGFTLLKPMDSDIIRTPLQVQIVNGRIQKESIIGIEAERFKYFLQKWNDEKMYQVVHLTYGIIPTAQRSLDKINAGEEDERVFGTCTVGIGFQGQYFKGKSGAALSHADGIILNASTWLDDMPIEIDGKFIHPELIPIIEGLFD